MGAKPKAWHEARQESFEARCLSEFMRTIKLPKAMRQRVEEAAKHHGSLHVGSFNEALPSFPFCLATHTGEKLKAFSRMDSFFKRKSIERICTLFQAALSSTLLSDDRPTLMLLRFSYLDMLMCIHNTIDSPVDSGHVQLRIVSTDGATLVLESVEALRIRCAEYLSDYYSQG